MPWIAVDFDGTLAQYNGYKGSSHYGEPIPAMVKIVKQYLEQGMEVRIFTARANDGSTVVTELQNWTEKVFGMRLKITATKDYEMLWLYDDRAFTVEKNTGKVLSTNWNPRTLSRND